MGDVSGQEISTTPTPEAIKSKVFEDAIHRAEASKYKDPELVDALNYAKAEGRIDGGRDSTRGGYWPGITFQANGVWAVAEASTSDKPASFGIGETGGIFQVEDILKLVTDDASKIVPKTTERFETHGITLPEHYRVKKTVWGLPNGVNIVNEVMSRRDPQTGDYVSTRAYAERPPAVTPAPAKAA